MNDESHKRTSGARRSGAGADAPKSPALDWVEPSGAVGLLYRELDLQLRRRRRRWQAAGGGLVALLLVAVVAGRRIAPDQPAGPAVAASVVSAPGRQALPDGSTVELNGDAAVRAEFTPSLRRVVLERGEAHFQVAKNAERPFVVVAAGLEVRAVGTAFSVEIGSRAVDVLVTEGKVAISGPAAPAGGVSRETGATPSTPTYVEAGSRAMVELASATPSPAAPEVRPVTPLEANERLAWRVPRVEFTMTPLQEAILVFRRHTGVKILLGDPAMGKLELSGVIRADNVESLLKLLETEFRIRAERQSDEIILRR